MAFSVGGLFGNAANSGMGFLGADNGAKAPGGQFSNPALSALNSGAGLYNGGEWANDLQDQMAKYGQGQGTANDVLGLDKTFQDTGARSELQDQLATGAMTGSRFATDQVQSNPILGGLYGQGGQLNQAEDKLSQLNSQGFELKPEDQTLYGQESGNIARQFGQQGNKVASDLASRGLSNSGAAGASFSGLAGNQNEMLAQAQQQIAQQRFQNTMGQIGQYQNFVNSMGANAGGAINQQYGRQLAGAQNRKQGLEQTASLQGGANDSQNKYGLAAAGFNEQNKPANFMDYATSGLGQRVQNYASGQGGQNGLAGGFGSSGLFGAGG